MMMFWRPRRKECGSEYERCSHTYLVRDMNHLQNLSAVSNDQKLSEAHEQAEPSYSMSEPGRRQSNDMLPLY